MAAATAGIKKSTSRRFMAASLCLGLGVSSMVAGPSAADELPIARLHFAAEETCVADDADLAPSAVTTVTEEGSALANVSVAWRWRSGDQTGALVTSSDVDGVVERPHVSLPTTSTRIQWNAKVLSAVHRTPQASAITRRVSDARSAGQLIWWAFGPSPFRSGAPVRGTGVARYLAGDGCPKAAPSGTVTIDARLRDNSGGWTFIGEAEVGADGTWSSNVAPPDVGTWEVRASVTQPDRLPSFATGMRTFEVKPEETALDARDGAPGQDRVAHFGAMHAMTWRLVHEARGAVRPVPDEPRTAELTFTPQGGKRRTVATLPARAVGGDITFSTSQKVTKRGTFVLLYRGTARELPSSTFRRVYLQSRAKGWPVTPRTYRRTTKVKRTIQLFDYDGGAVHLTARRGSEEKRTRLKVKHAANGRGSVVVTFPRAHRGRWTYTLDGVFGPTGQAPLRSWKVTRR